MTVYAIVVLPEAQDEMEAAFLWYFERSDKATDWFSRLLARPLEPWVRLLFPSDDLIRTIRFNCNYPTPKLQTATLQRGAARVRCEPVSSPPQWYPPRSGSIT